MNTRDEPDRDVVHLRRAVGVVGAGTMGVGIAHAFAIHGFDVTVCEADATRLAACRAVIARVLDDGVARGRLDEASAAASLDRVSYVSTVGELDAALDCIVEAVPERVELKQRVLGEIADRRPRIIGTNTSSLSIDELAAGRDFAGTLIGLHFFNPVWSMHLVELVEGTSTTRSTVEFASALVASIGKESILIADSPGFATSRLGLALGLEAIRMVEQGVGSAADIDRAMVLGYGHPIGPLRLTDLVGLDVRLDIARQLQRRLGERFAPPTLLVDMVGEGLLGKKVGRGFYVW